MNQTQHTFIISAFESGQLLKKRGSSAFILDANKSTDKNLDIFEYNQRQIHVIHVTSYVSADFLNSWSASTLRIPVIRAAVIKISLSMAHLHILLTS